MYEAMVRSTPDGVVPGILGGDGGGSSESGCLGAGGSLRAYHVL